MNENVVKSPRRVVPRWRDFHTTAAMGELGTLKPGPAPVVPRADIVQAKQQYAENKSLLSAGELLTAALIEQDWEALGEAANFLSQNDLIAPNLTKEIAKRAVEWAATQSPFPSKPTSATLAPVFNPLSIGLMRRVLGQFPYSAIHWVDLALGYSVIGRAEKSRRAMFVALRLAPNDRFVLRCATRLFLHQNEPDLAMKILNASTRTSYDAWLLSAHISVATILEKTSRLHRQARSLFAARTISPFHLSELGSALATTELGDGNDRRAKKLFRAALVDPTENSLAQALWAQDHFAVENKSQLLSLPRSFEANALFLVQVEKWDQAVLAADSWLNDEPFSGRPAILGSYLAGVAQEDYEKAMRIAISGLTANPGDPILTNNLAFAQACSGSPHDARMTLSPLLYKNLSPEQETAVRATDGLIEFRLGNLVAAKMKYHEAIAFARTHRLKSHLARATIHYAREALRANTHDAEAVVCEASDLGNNSTDPNVRLLHNKLLADIRIHNSLI